MEVDGILFDSRKEANRYIELKMFEKIGAITNLKRQVAYELIPNQYEKTNETYKKGINKGKPKKGKLLERKCCYVADFVYQDKDGRTVVEDTKGFRTTEYKIKKKLMLYIHQIKITEV